MGWGVGGYPAAQGEQKPATGRQTQSSQEATMVTEQTGGVWELETVFCSAEVD